ncbi:histidine kinase, partial [Bacillus sp. JJ722]
MAKNGILDLRDWDFDKEGPTSLRGEWELVEGALLSPIGFNNSKMKVYETVPGGWKSDKAIGTYRLIVYLPNDVKNIGISVRNIWSSHVLYVNGKKVKQMGKPSSTIEKTINKNVPYEYYQSVEEHKLELVIQVANYVNTDSGIVQPIDIGID